MHKLTNPCASPRRLTQSVVQGRRDMREGIFASLAETEPETVAARFLDANFYTRSVDFWPEHIRMAQAAGEISDEVSIPAATDFIMRMAVSMVMFPKMGLELKTRESVRAYLERVITAGLGPAH